MNFLCMRDAVHRLRDWKPIRCISMARWYLNEHHLLRKSVSKWRLPGVYSISGYIWRVLDDPPSIRFASYRWISTNYTSLLKLPALAPLANFKMKYILSSQSHSSSRILRSWSASKFFVSVPQPQGRKCHEKIQWQQRSVAVNVPVLLDPTTWQCH